MSQKKKNHVQLTKKKKHTKQLSHPQPRKKWQCPGKEKGKRKRKRKRQGAQESTKKKKKGIG